MTVGGSDLPASSDYFTAFSVENRYIALTGASGHLGTAIARLLVAGGATVLGIGRDRDKLLRLQSALGTRGEQLRPIPLDVSDEEKLAQSFAELDVPQLDGVVNNAAVGRTGSMRLAGKSEYMEGYDLLLASVASTIRLALPHLQKAAERRGDAAIVNVASMYGLVSPDTRVYDSESARNPPFYGAAKAALLQLTRHAACEFGPLGIRTNAVSPGPFPSEAARRSDPAFVERLASRVPLGRVGEAAEIAGAVAFLLSDGSKYVNGANLVVDGGWTAW